LVPEREVRRSMLRSLVDSLFAGDPAALVNQLLTARDVSARDLERMQALIDERRRAAKRREE
jgi:predicted transcriptional regulator